MSILQEIEEGVMRVFREGGSDPTVILASKRWELFCEEEEINPERDFWIRSVTDDTGTRHAVRICRADSDLVEVS